MSNGKIELSADTPIGKLAAKGIRVSDLLGIVVAVVLAFLSFALYEHRVETAVALRSMNKLMLEQVNAQRLNTCILALPEKRREQEYVNPNSFCRRITEVKTSDG